MDKKMVLCDRGHYFDASQTGSCPVCRNSKPVPETRPASQPAESGVYKAISKTRADSATIPVGADRDHPAPVVGWIVSINGPLKGKDYRLFTGFNSIGRSIANKVQITGDESISREKQAAIIFDHQNLKYYIQHGGGQNLSYVNKNPVLTPTEIKKGDHITIGNTEFIFIPFCDSTFSWQEKNE
ncbi:FHA domain-containing protein [Myxococcota bacterium]|nr:FHA domain-containing protein [Myxococcota bacterium]MBU1533853.1 FHA domain-containing protein [Myxococcota bacterium]